MKNVSVFDGMYTETLYVFISSDSTGSIPDNINRSSVIVDLMQPLPNLRHSFNDMLTFLH